MAEKKLNKEQLAAIKSGKGPLLIIAGAGSGKTTVVTERIKWLVAKGLAKPAEILALTFTDKAAREMEERVDLAMPYGYTEMWISTFHAFCDRVLRAEAIHIGLDPGYKLMTEAETIQFLIRHLFKFDLQYFRPLGNPTKFIGGMLQHFSRLKDEDVMPNEYLHWARTKHKEQSTKEEVEKYLELAKAYQTYEDLKIKEGKTDFGDLLSQVLRLFRTRKNILHQYQALFKYILVDEFQDTNFAQNELAILLAGSKQNITVCADDDQAIYRWRGAAISNVIQFRKRFPKAKIVSLVKNYRSTQEILDRAYGLIQNNNPDRLEVKEKINKKLVAMRGLKGEKVQFLHADRVENEAETVAKEIVNLKLKIENLQYKDIAILVRANNQADPFSRALNRLGIPYQFLGPGQLFRQPEVKDLIAYLEVLYNFDNSVALFRVLSMPHFAIFPRDLAAIGNYGRRLNLSLFEACEKIGQILVSAKTQQQIANFVAMVHRHLGLLAKETAGQILYYFLQDSGLLKKLTEYKLPLEERQAQNISKLFDRLKTYEVDHEDASVSAVVDWLNLAMQLGESPLASNSDWTEENRVNLLTVHSSKGLEFPVVFLVNLVADRFPTRQRQEQIPLPEALVKETLPAGDSHQQEERRLFYVGMTRARDRLYLTAADYYGEGKREKKLSPFVGEALGEAALAATKTNSHQLSILDWAQPEEEARPVTINHTPINYLSFSQAEIFNTCPLQYRYRYLARIPVPPSAALSLGDAMHKTLRDFYQDIKDGRQLRVKDLLAMLKINWSAQGFASKAHEQKAYRQAEDMLTRFYQVRDKTAIPKDLEQPFMIKISPELKIGGKMDWVAEKGRQLEIVDYKTGRVWDQKAVDQSLQMTIYALAATDGGIYNRRPEDLILTFYFLETGERKSTRRTAAQLAQTKKDLVIKAENISRSDFSPTPGRWCDWCDFKLICEAW